MLHENRYDTLIIYYTSISSLDPKQIKRQIRRESNFNPSAISPAGAKGLMQFMLPTWRDLANVDDDIFNPELQIAYGCRYMSLLLSMFKKDLKLALASYNWGPGNVGHSTESVWPAETLAYVAFCLDYGNEVVLGA